MKTNLRSAFTLIELLIVVAIIAILAAIAVPNFLEAQVRAKTSRVKADMRTAATALESYYVDYNRYPPHYDQGATTVNIDASKTLFRLTTPIAYITSVDVVRDTFSVNAQVVVGPGIPGAGSPAFQKDYFTYQTYQTFVEDYSFAPPFRNITAWGLQSVGPDKGDDAIHFRLYNYACVENAGFQAQFIVGVYDPTNGTISVGDIPRFGGEVPAVAGIINK